MDALYLIDKPSGITSFWALREMRKTLCEKKMGHTGTLDPLATGCLLVATGKYTKLIPYFEKDTKEYTCEILLNGVSDSFDIDTPIEYISDSKQEKYKNELTREYIEPVLEKHFLWEIEQTPPAYSALKINWKKAVDLVRAGKTPEMKTRPVTISEIEILGFCYPRLQLRVSVSAGTYIRSIAKDLWDILGTGGYISALRRTKIGEYACISQAIQLADISTENYLDERSLFSVDMFFPLQDSEVLWRLENGQRVAGEFDFPVGRDIFLFFENKIQYIVKYESWVLTPVRKIL